MRFIASCVTAVMIGTISVARVHSFSIAKHVDITASSSIESHRWRCSGERDVTLLAKKPNDDDDETIIDAIVEEKTAGLALNDDEENTTVSIDIFYRVI